MKIVLLIGYGGRPVDTIREVSQEISNKFNVVFKTYFMNEVNLEDRWRIIEKDIKESRLIFIYSYDVPDRLCKLLENENREKIIISIDPYTMNLSNVDFEIVKKAREYFIKGGVENYRRLLKFLLKLCGFNVDVEEPVDVPWDGIYHPDYGLFTDLKSYLDVYKFANRPLVGILFYRSYWLFNDLEPIVKLVHALEDERLGVVPVFTYGHRDSIVCTPSKADTCRKFFFSDGKCVIDFLIDFTSFFFLQHPFSCDKYEQCLEENVLKILNVPVMRPILMWYRSVEEWLQSEQGVDYLTQVYQVIMPEVDGLVEPIVLAGARRDETGIIRKVEAVDEHVRYIARRVRKWVALRRKPRHEVKIAIVLHNPPCKGLEANVAVGLGLDVLESVVHVLRRLRELGYRVENIPESGRELAKLILERRAISEFRWTSVEDIVRRGGALDFVDAETYMSWFNELPEPVKEKTIKDWGHPLDVLSGKVRKELVGMVYEGKFVVPGLRFGNVVVLPQPKFGCAGPRCDGKVCRILHDPTITPPHQWLAVYRWITRKFGADVIIHFGTHGYLEFRPGKGVGLSWMCWPEISIDDAPHLYVYVVSNPMEGVIAKRRSYAVLIDHMYPPMSLPEELEELEELLTQYSRARGLGEHSRASAIFEKILETAKKLNITLSETEPEKVVEELHRYLDMVKNTQINLGLHVFGKAPDVERAVEYAVTVLHKDSPRAPSIIRTIVELLGLDYDELRKNPGMYIEKFGMCAREILSKARRVAYEALLEMVKRNCRDASCVEEILLTYVRKFFDWGT